MSLYRMDRTKDRHIAHPFAGARATETLTLQLPPDRAYAVQYPEGFVSRVRELAVNHHDDEIAQLLGAEGYQSSTGKPLTQCMVQ